MNAVNLQLTLCSNDFKLIFRLVQQHFFEVLKEHHSRCLDILCIHASKYWYVCIYIYIDLRGKFRLIVILWQEEQSKDQTMSKKSKEKKQLIKPNRNQTGSQLTPILVASSKSGKK